MKSLGALGWGKLNRDGTKQKLRKKQPKIDDFVEEKNKFAYATEEGNIQLGGQAVPTEKEKLVSSLGAQNKQTKVTIREKSDFCPNCGKGISERQHKDYPETQAKGAYCPTCRQNKDIAARDKKDRESSNRMADDLHRDLSERMGKHGIKVERFS
jgi:ribosomal protein S27AE